MILPEIKPHPFKSRLKAHNITQQQVGKLLKCSIVTVASRLSGYSPFKPEEEALLNQLFEELETNR